MAYLATVGRQKRAKGGEKKARAPSEKEKKGGRSFGKFIRGEFERKETVIISQPMGGGGGGNVNETTLRARKIDAGGWHGEKEEGDVGKSLNSRQEKGGGKTLWLIEYQSVDHLRER